MQESAFYMIGSNMTGERDKDKSFLQDQLQAQIENGALEEVIIPFAQTLYDMSTDTEKLEILKKVSPKIAKQLLSIRVFVRSPEDKFNDMDVAEYLIDNLLDEYCEDDGIKYCIFDNPLQEKIFRLSYTGSEEIRTIPPNEDFTNLIDYYVLSLLSLGRKNEAVTILLEFLEINPYHYEALYNIYEDNKDNAGLIKLFKHVLKYSYNPKEIAVIYHKLGYIYDEYHWELELAAANFAFSILYSDPGSPAGFFFNSMMNRTSLDGIDFIKLLKENDVPVGVNPSVISALSYFSKDSECDAEIKEYATGLLNEFSTIEIPEAMDVHWVFENCGLNEDPLFRSIQDLTKSINEGMAKRMDKILKNKK